jgi:hypothetical protein
MSDATLRTRKVDFYAYVAGLDPSYPDLRVEEK